MALGLKQSLTELNIRKYLGVAGKGGQGIRLTTSLPAVS
jgi:hypothetical protein